MKTENNSNAYTFTADPAELLTPIKWTALVRKTHAAKIAAKAYDDLKEQVKHYLKLANSTTMTVGGFTITLKSVTTKRLNEKKLREEHPELLELLDQYTEPTTSERLYIK